MDNIGIIRIINHSIIVKWFKNESDFHKLQDLFNFEILSNDIKNLAFSIEIVKWYGFNYIIIIRMQLHKFLFINYCSKIPNNIKSKQEKWKSTFSQYLGLILMLEMWFYYH